MLRVISARNHFPEQIDAKWRVTCLAEALVPGMGRGAGRHGRQLRAGVDSFQAQSQVCL